MNERVTSQKCRTCLKSSTKTFHLTKQVIGCPPHVTYEHILQEYVQLEGTAGYESHLPQYLCFLCSCQLKSTYIFIQEARRCNIKLINDLNMQLCLEEKEIDLPQLQEEATVSIMRVNPDIRNGKNNNHDNDLVKTEPFLKMEEIIEYDSEDNIDTDIAGPILEAVPIIKYDFEDNVESDDNFSTEMTEYIVTYSEEVNSSSAKIETLEPVEPFLESIQCTVCYELIAEHDTLLNHMRIYHGDSKANLEKSEEKQNVADRVYKCQFCDHTARTYSGLKYHNRAKHPTEYKILKCNFCSYTTTLNKFTLLNHIKTEHKELIKAMKSSTGSNFGERVKSNINNTFNENDSNDSLTSRSDQEYISDNADTEQDKEELSEENFIRNMLNMKEKSTTKTLVRRCEECGKIYPNYKSLSAHQHEVHKGEDKFSVCPYCDKKCKRKAGLNFHIKNAHGTEEDKQQSKPRSKEKRFMCAECPYTCTTSTVLNIHIRVHHTGERPYKCDICDKRFVVPYDLKIHRYLHTGEKPYDCTICQRKFRDPSHLRKHTRLHTNKNPFTCDECGKGFTQSYNLSVHKRTHLKGNKLSCSVCGKFFRNKSSLNIHQIKENHYDEAV